MYGFSTYHDAHGLYGFSVYLACVQTGDVQDQKSCDKMHPIKIGVLCLQ